MNSIESKISTATSVLSIKNLLRDAVLQAAAAAAATAKE
jgi:hypothetical protein